MCFSVLFIGLTLISNYADFIDIQSNYPIESLYALIPALFVGKLLSCINFMHIKKKLVEAGIISE
jgi:hypothetical protein